MKQGIYTIPRFFTLTRDENLIAEVLEILRKEKGAKAVVVKNEHVPPLHTVTYLRESEAVLVIVKNDEDIAHNIAENLAWLLGLTSGGIGKSHAIIHGAANSERKIAAIARTGADADLLVKKIKSVNPKSDVFPVTLRELGEIFDLNIAFNGVVPIIDHSVVEFLALRIMGYDSEFLLNSLCPFNDPVIAARRQFVLSGHHRLSALGHEADVVILPSENDSTWIAQNSQLSGVFLFAHKLAV